MARRKTGRLVALMVLAVLSIIVLVYAVVVLAASTQVSTTGPRVFFDLLPAGLPYGQLFLFTAGGVLAIVLGGSLFKTGQLAAGGGKSVALALGGRPVEPGTADPRERRLLNVVEEMAIAAGCPVPPVYLLDHEPGINAFAAGWSLEDAVVGVTAGAVEHFTRDELQGVIAHEFSHILHGDMRINLRLVGLIFGILVLSVLGATAMRMIGHMRHTRTTRDKDNNAAAVVLAIFLAGLALYIIGYVGVFFGRLIQAAVSRQREFLADASAVQYTRNPDGIADALKRLGGLTQGSRLRTAHAQEHRHLFFGEAVSGWLGGVLATHPPLKERIRRVQPSWDGQWLAPGAGEADALRPSAGTASGSVHVAPLHAPQAPPQVSRLGGAGVEATALRQIGNPMPAHVAYARQLIDALPTPLRDAPRTPTGASALVLALLMDRRQPAVRQRQEQYLREHVGGPVASLTVDLAGDVQQISSKSYLPLLELALPTLRRLPDAEAASLQRHAGALAEADAQVSVFEWALTQVLRRSVSPPDGRRGSGRLRLRAVKADVEVMLRVLAAASGRDPMARKLAFAAGAREVSELSMDREGAEPLLPRRLSAAVDRLAQLDPREQQKVIAACAAAIAADGEATTGEAELMRAVAETLGVPIPPVLPGQRLA